MLLGRGEGTGEVEPGGGEHHATERLGQPLGPVRSPLRRDELDRLVRVREERNAVRPPDHLAGDDGRAVHGLFETLGAGDAEPHPPARVNEEEELWVGLLFVLADVDLLETRPTPSDLAGIVRGLVLA